MSASPFEQLFVSQSSSKFKEDNTACSPQQSKAKRTWKIYLSRQDEMEMEIEAGNFSDACTKAVSKVKRETGKDDWQVDHFTPNLQYPSRRKI